MLAARDRQRARFERASVRVNVQMTSRHVRRFCAPPPDAERLLSLAMSRLGLSARGYDRVLKVARTIADLAGAEDIAAEHCAEAIQYRGLDRQLRPQAAPSASGGDGEARRCPSVSLLA